MPLGVRAGRRFCTIFHLVSEVGGHRIFNLVSEVGGQTIEYSTWCQRWENIL